ncbi:MAG: class I SAM-dependent methyltransferase [Candidatus Curtissbacteria bacterium]|nr:class I SAM-dependent methyltransferase [Candidatus Curtissbacteria bacterium]
MSTIQKIAKRFFDKYYKNMHPEAALRYFPVVQKLKDLKLEGSKILEIGSGSLGITPYLKKPVDGIDIDFSGPETPLVNKIKAGGVILPFHKNSYDVVIAVDVLEHIEPYLRAKAISEWLKVAKKLVIIVVPIGQFSEKQDRELDLYWQKVFKDKNLFLTEHVKNGLPQAEEILVNIDKLARQLGKKAKVNSRPLLNLGVRKFLMKTWISKNKYKYYLYLKGYLLLLPLLKYANFGKCYRRIFVVEFVSPAEDRSSSRATSSR